MHNAGGRSEVAIGVQVASFVLDRGFSEFYRLSTVSVGLLLLCPHLCRYVRRPRLFIPSIRYVCWSHGTAGLSVLRVVTELYMIVRDLFQLSWLISWLTTARHPASFQLTRMSVSYHYWHERAIIRLVPRCHTATYKPTLLRGSLDNPS